MNTEYNAGPLVGEVKFISFGGNSIPARIIPDERELPEPRLTLTEDESAWLEEYCIGLQENFAECIEELIVYGFPAEGISHEDLDLNALVVICEDNKSAAEEVSEMGYQLDMSKYFVAPLITVHTSSEWSEIKQENDPFYWSAINEGVPIIQ